MIRFHIRALVLSWLGSLTDPTVEEWRTIAPHLVRSDDPLLAHCWGLLYSNAWFQVADAEGSIEWLLDHDDSRVVDRAVSVLRAIERDRPARVAELLEPYVGRSDDWNRRLVAVTQWADLGADRRFFDLALRLIDEGVLDEAQGPIATNSDFWDVGYGLDERAVWAVEWVRHYLNRRLLLAEARGVSNPFDRSEGTIPEVAHGDQFLKAAEGAPEEFVTQLLPFFLRVMESSATGEGDDDGLRRDPVWSYRYRSDRFGTDGLLLAAMERALELFASRDPAAFSDVVDQLGSTGFETANFLAVRGFLGAPEELAEEAADYLLVNPSRFRAGYSDDEHWATRELLAAIYLRVKPKTRRGLEESLLTYETFWERLPGGHKSRGRARFVLLSGVPEELLSEKAAKELAMLRRKFGRDEPTSPRGIISGFIGSPISREATEKMTDQQWLRAIERYAGDREWEAAGDSLRGGAEELAHELSERAKEDPLRFAALVEAIPDSANTVYFDAILRGVAGAEAVDVEPILRICRRCHDLPERPCGRWIPMAVEAIAAKELPDELVEILEWYARNDPDPESEIWQVKPEGAESPYYGGDIHMAGINSARGAAAMAVGALIAEDGTRAGRFDGTLEHLASDSSLAVRSCAAYALLAAYVYGGNRDRAVELFEQLVTASDDLLATGWVERFAANAARTHLESIEPLIRRMLGSEIESVQTVGGRQAVIASIFDEEFIPLAVMAAEHPSGAVRRGAAQVAAANISDADAYAHLAAILTSLFEDSEAEVRSETASAFRRLTERPGAEWASLLEAFVASTAFEDGAGELFYSLGEASDPPPGQTIAACARLAGLLLDEGDPFSARGLDTDRASQLLLRIYQGAEGDAELRTQALDAIDELARLQAYGLDKALAAFER